MNPETARKLMETVPEMQEFVSYLQEVAQALNRLDDIPEDNLLAPRILGRKEAYQTVQKILRTLLDLQETPTPIDLREYLMDPEEV